MLCRQLMPTGDCLAHGVDRDTAVSSGRALGVLATWQGRMGRRRRWRLTRQRGPCCGDGQNRYTRCEDRVSTTTKTKKKIRDEKARDVNMWVV
jgi:hypothetical protein